eukprot:TRINITY_DN117_c0_g3_i1.p1 TRINITY_DN117_c0_g3~~TRINITY_DN117_c0_g3_i1.p1  ORF type:complete len:579 (+),score=176.03 TRINITY_DN117_c0_g3_i1:608-2344(+)
MTLEMGLQEDGGESVRMHLDARGSILTSSSHRSDTWIMEEGEEEKKDDGMVPAEIYAEVRKGALERGYDVVYEHGVKQPRGKKVHINGKLLIVKPKAAEECILFWVPHSALLKVNPELLTNKETEAVVEAEEATPQASERESKYMVKIALDSIYSMKVEGKDVTLNILDDNKSVRSVSLLFDGSCKEFKRIVMERLRFVQKEPHVWVRSNTTEEAQKEYRDWLYDKPTADGIARGLLGLVNKGFTSLSNIISEAHSDDASNRRGSSPAPPEHPTIRLAHSDFRMSIPKPCLPTPTRSLPPPLTLDQYNELSAAGDINSIKKLTFRGSCTAEARPHVWRAALGIDLAQHDTRKALYEKYYAQYTDLTDDQLRHCECVVRQITAIDKDIYRTDRDLPVYRDEHGEGMQAMRKILVAYTMYNRDLGYVQGMSDIAAVCWYVFRDEVDGFWGFVKVMERCLGSFTDHGEKERGLLRKIVEVVNPTLAEHLSKEDPVSMFAFRWVFLLFKREFPFLQILSLWDVLFTAPTNHYHLFIAASLLNLLSDFFFLSFSGRVFFFIFFPSFPYFSLWNRGEAGKIPFF